MCRWKHVDRYRILLNTRTALLHLLSPLSVLLNVPLGHCPLNSACEVFDLIGKVYKVNTLFYSGVHDAKV